MNISELWIGDQLLIISLNQRGQFEGIDPEGYVMVRVSGGLKKVLPEDLSISVETEEESSISLIDDDDNRSFKPIKPRILNGHVIDLHYEKLAPERQKNPHPHIIEFQLEKCKEFMEMAIDKKYSFIRIIHGRGQGKLKSAVKELLKNYLEVNLVTVTPDSGALEVWLR